jgi:hypothetical protein
MKVCRQFLPPRQAVIYAFTRRMLDETALDATTFAMAVAERYVAATAPDVRQVKLRTGEGPELLKAMENNGQVLRRYMDGTVKTLPADLEDAWVLALPEPYRSDCERELAKRRGRLSFEVLEGPGEAADSIGAVFTEAGQLCTAWGKAIANGEISQAELIELLNESDDVILAVMRFRHYAQQRAAAGGAIHA